MSHEILVIEVRVSGRLSRGERSGCLRAGSWTASRATPPATGPLRGAQEPHIWLPTTRGEGAKTPFANSPAWVRNTPGWYIPSTVSAGVCMLDFPFITFLSKLIRNFRELPALSSWHSRSGRTACIWWIGSKASRGAPPFNYWMNKGDYIPRSNVGGPAALKEGIAALHEKRGNSATRRGVSTPIRSKARARARLRPWHPSHRCTVVADIARAQISLIRGFDRSTLGV